MWTLSTHACAVGDSCAQLWRFRMLGIGCTGRANGCSGWCIGGISCTGRLSVSTGGRFLSVFKTGAQGGASGGSTPRPSTPNPRTTEPGANSAPRLGTKAASVICSRMRATVSLLCALFGLSALGAVVAVRARLFSGNSQTLFSSSAASFCPRLLPNFSGAT